MVLFSSLSLSLLHTHKLHISLLLFYLRVHFFEYVRIDRPVNQTKKRFNPNEWLQPKVQPEQIAPLTLPFIMDRWWLPAVTCRKVGNRAPTLLYFLSCAGRFGQVGGGGASRNRWHHHGFPLLTLDQRFLL